MPARPSKLKIEKKRLTKPQRGKSVEWTSELAAELASGEGESAAAAPAPVVAAAVAELPAQEGPANTPARREPKPEAPLSNDEAATLLAAAEAAEYEAALTKLKAGAKLTAAEKRLIRNRDGGATAGGPDGGGDAGEFSAERAAESLGAYWVNGDGGNFYVPEGGRWLRITKERFEARLAEAGIPSWPMGGDTISPREKVTLHVERCRTLDRCIEGLAGYGAGVRMIHGHRTLLQRGPKLIQPEPGDWSLIESFVAGRLAADPASLPSGTPAGEAMRPVYLFEGWLQRGLENLYLAGDENLPGQLLALAGEAGTGKSRLQHFLLTPLLGGRAADPQPYLFGETDFNDEWIQAEHLLLEDPRTATKMHDRVELARRLKGLVANDDHRLRALYRGAMTVNPKFRVSMTFNSDPDAMRFFPPLTPDFRDKVIFLKVHARPLPMATDTPEERRQFREALTAQLPAYLHYLLYEFKLPAALHAGRFGVVEYADPEIRAILGQDNIAAEFLEIIDSTVLVVDRASGVDHRGGIWKTVCGHAAAEAFAEYTFASLGSNERQLMDRAKAEGRRVWIGHFSQLHEQLIDVTASLRGPAQKLISNNSIPRMLSALSREAGLNRVATYAHSGKRLYLILEPKE